MTTLIQAIRVRNRLGAVRELVRQAERAAAEAERERERLAANPDGTRGDLTEAEYRESIADRAAARVGDLYEQMKREFRPIGDDIRDLRRRAGSGGSESAATAAWQRAKPMLDAGATLAEAITFALDTDDADYLAALHRYMPAWLAARHGASPNDPQVRIAVAEALAAIERGQERGGYIDYEHMEFRSLDRESRALADEADARFRLAMKQARATATPTDTIATGLAVNAAKRIADGAPDAEAVTA